MPTHLSWETRASRGRRVGVARAVARHAEGVRAATTCARRLVKIARDSWPIFARDLNSLRMWQCSGSAVLRWEWALCVAHGRHGALVEDSGCLRGAKPWGVTLLMRGLCEGTRDRVGLARELELGQAGAGFVFQRLVGNQ